MGLFQKECSSNIEQFQSLKTLMQFHVSIFSQINVLPNFLCLIVFIYLSLLYYVMRSAIWYHSYNLKNVKNTHGGVLLLVKLHANPAALLKVTLLHGCFSRFLNYTNGTKPRKASQFTICRCNPAYNQIHSYIYKNLLINIKYSLVRNTFQQKHPHHVQTSQPIRFVNQLTGFYMIRAITEKYFRTDATLKTKSKVTL